MVSAAYAGGKALYDASSAWIFRSSICSYRLRCRQVKRAWDRWEAEWGKAVRVRLVDSLPGGWVQEVQVIVRPQPLVEAQVPPRRQCDVTREV